MGTLFTLLSSLAGGIIDRLEDEFDSHDFINALMHSEGEYLRALERYSAFRTFHAQIGRYLSINQRRLGIGKDGRRMTRNVKGDVSVNQGWRKRNNI
ncbi:MAG: hypothetical protein PHG78_07575 [Bacteroidales bacterium]|nr:hypothetical protein [Bacteroidales bacterium]